MNLDLATDIFPTPNWYIYEVNGKIFIRPTTETIESDDTYSSATYKKICEIFDRHISDEEYEIELNKQFSVEITDTGLKFKDHHENYGEMFEEMSGIWNYWNDNYKTVCRIDLTMKEKVNLHLALINKTNELKQTFPTWETSEYLTTWINSLQSVLDKIDQ